MQSYITIQPQSPKEDPLKLPYPFMINTDDGMVRRQDFWKGTPLKLICFAKAGETIAQLDFKQFVKKPQRAVGLCPVFEHKNGEWFTYSNDVIASVSVSEVEGTKVKKAAYSVRKAAAKKRR